MKIFKVFAAFLMMLSSLMLTAQKLPIGEQDYSNSSIEMADAMRADGKIYILVAIILIIFIGFIVYLFRTEQKVKKLEEEIKNRQ